MKESAYIHHYTSEVPPQDRMTKEQAQMAWLRDVNPQNRLTEKDKALFGRMASRIKRVFVTCSSFKPEPAHKKNSFVFGH